MWHVLKTIAEFSTLVTTIIVIMASKGTVWGGHKTQLLKCAFSNTQEQQKSCNEKLENITFNPSTSDRLHDVHDNISVSKKKREFEEGIVHLLFKLDPSAELLTFLGKKSKRYSWLLNFNLPLRFKTGQNATDCIWWDFLFMQSLKSIFVENIIIQIVR